MNLKNKATFTMIGAALMSGWLDTRLYKSSCVAGENLFDFNAIRKARKRAKSKKRRLK